MLGWAVIINNVGRRRYPLHWWAPGATFVRVEEDLELEKAEEGEIKREEMEEGELERESTTAASERLSGDGGKFPEALQRTSRGMRRESVQAEPASLQSAVDASPGEFSNRRLSSSRERYRLD